MTEPTIPLLAVDRLTVQFRVDRGWLTAVDDVSFAIGERECVGLVGESGSGKSVTALSLLRLHDPRLTRVSSPSADGAIRYRGQDLMTLPTPSAANASR